jgi:hypothetical protein
MTTTTQARKVEQALADIENAKQYAVDKGMSSPDYIRIWDGVARMVKKSGDPSAVFDWLIGLVAEELAENGARK